MVKVIPRVVAIVLVLMLLGALGFFIWAKQPVIAEVSPPAASDFDQTTIAKGAMLASMGYCAECHTAQGGAAFAGGYPVPTPFGTIYGSNITPDTQTGIGNWSEAAFVRAMHEGVARSGTYLYPAFPYNHFTLYCGGPRPLRRLPHAAQCARCRNGPGRVRWRRERGLARPRLEPGLARAGTLD
jgi:hypothetical protein